MKQSYFTKVFVIKAVLKTAPTNLFLLLFALILTGCVSVQQKRDKRIETQQADFSRLPTNTQTRVRTGEVALGDAPLTVWFALGKPSHEFSQLTLGGSNMVWSYTRQDVRVRHEIAPSSYGQRCTRGETMLRTTQVTETEQQRITFATNAVIAIDLPQQ